MLVAGVDGPRELGCARSADQHPRSNSRCQLECDERRLTLHRVRRWVMLGLATAGRYDQKNSATMRCPGRIAWARLEAALVSSQLEQAHN